MKLAVHEALHCFNTTGYKIYPYQSWFRSKTQIDLTVCRMRNQNHLSCEELGQSNIVIGMYANMVVW